jgi:hypothetical protein
VTALAAYIAEVLARPDVREARLAASREAHRERQRQSLQYTPTEDDAHHGELPDGFTTYYAVRGPWRAEDLEPCLASPRSSLHPAFTQGEEEA